MQTRNYEAQDGRRVYVTEVLAESVQFLEPRSVTNNRGGENGFYSGQKSQDFPFSPNQNQQRNENYTRVDEDPFANDGQQIDISDDDLPF